MRVLGETGAERGLGFGMRRENVTYTLLAMRTGLVSLFVEDLKANGSLTCNSTVVFLPTSSLDAADQYSCDGLHK